MNLFKRLKAAAFATVGAIALAVALHQPAVAGQTPTMGWCAVQNLLTGNPIGSAAPVENMIGYQTDCGVQFGDIFTDGPIYNPIPGTSGLVFTIPPNTWVSFGQKVIVTSTTNLTLTASSTNYIWLACNLCSGNATGVFIVTLTSTPPNGYSTLMYTAVTNSSSITAYTPTFSQAALASGLLQVYGVDGSIFYGRIAAQSPAALQLYNNTTSLTMGGQAAFQALYDDSGCVDGPANQEKIFQFFNHSGSSPVMVGCSTDTGDVLTPALTVHGNSVFAGPLTVNSTIMNGGLPTPGPGPSPTVEPVCGSATVALEWCPNGLAMMEFAPNMPTTTVAQSGCAGFAVATYILNVNTNCVAGIAGPGWPLSLSNVSGTQTFSWLATPFPLATSGAIEVDTTYTSSSSVAAVTMKSSGTNICDATHNPSNLFFQLLDDLGTNMFKMSCSGVATFNQLKPNQLTITGLSSATVSPVCAPNNAPATQCSGQSGLGGVNATPSPGPTAQATTNGTGDSYTTIQQNSVTLGTSYGPQGMWFGVVNFDAWVTAGNSSAAAEICIISSSTVTTETRTADGPGGNTCHGSPVNSLAGAPRFGLAPAVFSSSTIWETPLTSHAMWTGTAANGASITVNCEGASGSTTVLTIVGTCPMWWIPI